MNINTIPYQQHLPQLVRHPPGALSQSSASAATASTSKPVFEFTKRKKWDDLLLSELHLTILFILSLSSQQSSSKILFTGYNSALSDVLGYSDTELLDSSFGDIMNERDGQVWQSIVDDAVRAHNPGTIGMFVRLKRKSPTPPPPPASNASSQFPNTWTPSPAILPSLPPPPPPPPRLPDVLFEIRGHVHFADPLPSSEPEPLCVLAAATPYPSTVSNALNSFLEQKIEHERLLKRVRTLQARSNNCAISPQQDSVMSDPLQSYLFSTEQSTQLNSHGYTLTATTPITPTDPRLQPSNPPDHSTLYASGSSMPFTSRPSPYTTSRPLAVPQLEDDEESRRKKVGTLRLRSFSYDTYYFTNTVKEGPTICLHNLWANRFPRVAKGTPRPQNFMQCMWTPVGEEGSQDGRLL